MVLYLLINYMILFIFILISISFFTLFERKILSYIQFRKGPNKVGFMGVLQALSDGVKLFSNEFMILYQSNLLIYLFSPILMFIISMFMWIIIPMDFMLMSVNNLFIILFCLLSVNIYPMMFMGIYSNSLYSNLGGVRSISQTISYEVSFFILILSLLIFLESLNLMEFYYFKMFLIYMYPLGLMFFISILAELNRTPFDFSEGESELISGYNIEYMSGGFALIFLGEYSNIMFLMMLFILMFLNLNYWFFFMLEWLIFLYIIIMIRALLPRLRYDKLMYLIWLNFLPISLNYFIYIIFLKYFLLGLLF